MNFLTSKRFVTAALALLVALNITLLGLVWWQNIRKTEERSVKITRQFNQQVYLAGPLSLSEEQSLHFKKLREKHFRKARTDIGAIVQAKKELIMESLKEQLDTARIRMLAEAIGKQQVLIEQKQAMHFHELALVCTPVQRDSLRKMLEQIATRKLRFTKTQLPEPAGEIQEINIIREER